jgi:hypothetical protein
MRKEIIRIFATMAVVFLVVSALWAGSNNNRFLVISTVPTDRARGVPTDQMLTVTFNQKVNCTTITKSSFTLQVGTVFGRDVKGLLGCLGTQATFTPASDLEPNTKYTATISDAVKDVNGQRIVYVSCYIWSFRTGSGPIPPTVTAVTPLNGATGVALNLKVITATFDQAMNPATIIAANFTVSGGVTGTVSVDITGTIATFKITSGNLTASTTYTATITTGVENLDDNAMASNFVWTFKTGAAPDLIPPTVISTIPLSGATGVPLNQIITATFSKAMAPLTVTTPPQFILQKTSGLVTVPGTVTYAVIGNTASFTPTLNLLPSTNYTATIETGVTDLAGNYLVSNYVWKFTTGAATVTTAPTVVSTNPANNGTVCINGAINATFSEAMDFGTFNSGTFYVTGPASAPVLGTLSEDVTGTIVTFTPTSPLTSGTTYQATITTGVTDLFGNPLGSNHVWNFTASGTCVAAVALNSAAPFGVLGGGGGVTNSGILTVINGDMGTTGASTLVVGFHDLTNGYTQFTHGCIYSETLGGNGAVGLVTGEIYSAAGASIPSVALNCTTEGTGITAGIAAAAIGDATTAYGVLAGLPGGPSESGQLGNKTLYAGTYTSSTGFLITGGDLTLDAQGNANAVWVFQMPSSSLTVGDSACRNVILAGGAQAKNVFWQVGSAATINGAGGCTMVGTIIASAAITFSTAGNVALTVLDGRALSLTSATLVDTVINVPLP